MLNYLLPRDVVNALDRERVTGLHCGAAAVDPAHSGELAESIAKQLRYIANTAAAAARNA